MDFKLSEEEQSVRTEMFEVCLELEKKQPSGWTHTREQEYASSGAYYEYDRLCAKEFAKRGWLSIDWPVEYGGQGRSKIYKAFLAEATGYHKVSGVDQFGVDMLPPTLLEFGSEEQKKEFLPPVARADVIWSQLWSEPNAGSDLANVYTRGVRKGDVYVVNGQKTWTSGAHRAHWGFMLIKTDPDAQPKHRGLSFILVDMKSPGITVSPIPFMNLMHTFNDVFFDDVEIPAKHLVGEENKGWRITRGTMDAERSGMGSVARMQRDLEELVEFCRNTKTGGKPLSENPIIRNRLAETACELEATRALGYRLAWAQDKGVMSAVEASANKVFAGDLTVRFAYLGNELLGVYGQVRTSKWAPLTGYYEDMYQSTFAETVSAGTNEIQRNIIAWEGLGLPRMR